MPPAVHFNPAEHRDRTGKWTRGGAVLKRLATEAGSARTAPDHATVLGHVSSVQKGTGRTISGHRIDRTQGDRYRVGLRTADGRSTKVYDSPEDAAKAIAEGKHHEAGGAAAGGAAPRAADKFSKGDRVISDTGVAGEVTSSYTSVNGERMVKIRYRPGPGGLRTVRESDLKSHSAGNAPALPKDLQAKLRDIQAAEKARVEAENKATGRGGVTENKSARGRLSGDTGYTPGKGVGGRYRGAKPASHYEGLSTTQLENLVRSRGSQAAEDELRRRGSGRTGPVPASTSGEDLRIRPGESSAQWQARQIAAHEASMRDRNATQAYLRTVANKSEELTGLRSQLREARQQMADAKTGMEQDRYRQKRDRLIRRINDIKEYGG